MDPPSRRQLVGLVEKQGGEVERGAGQLVAGFRCTGFSMEGPSRALGHQGSGHQHWLHGRGQCVWFHELSPVRDGSVGVVGSHEGHK